jgi:acetylornithine deacetylase/succinyl-diaminopimelate desuccinylase-like protein
VPSSIDWDALRDECVAHLQALLRLNTTNPPGNETLAAAYLADVLQREGIPFEVIEGAPGRGNVVARLRSDGSGGPALMLTGHVDVVSVEREKWTRDPFGGELVDGFVWGRGALDMKSQVAAELTVLLWLKRSGVPLKRDVLFVALADEEAGGRDGAAWLWANHRELLDAEFAVNEGGGTAIEINGQRFYLLQAGEKGASRLRITARANPGHASVPLDDTAMARLGRALVRLHEWQPPTTLTAPVRQFLATIAPALGPGYEARVQAILAEPSWEAIAALPIDDDTRLMLRATTRNTAVPTIVHGGHRINVIPSEIVLDVDGRILPGQDPDDWRAQVQAVVGDEVEVALRSRERGIAFDPSGALFDAIATTVDELDPGAKVVPFLVSGGTDARNLPGVKVLGFFPFPVSERTALYSTLVHGHDERIAVEDLAFATRFLYEVVVRFCASA